MSDVYYIFNYELSTYATNNEENIRYIMRYKALKQNVILMKTPTITIQNNLCNRGKPLIVGYFIIFHSNHFFNASLVWYNNCITALVVMTYNCAQTHSVSTINYY